jgi:hypothetical protein
MLHAVVAFAVSLSVHTAALAALIVAPGLVIDRVLPGAVGRFLWASGIVIVTANAPHHDDTLVLGVLLTLLLAGVRWSRTRPTVRRGPTGDASA